MPPDEQFRQAYRDAYRAAWSDADYRREALEKQAIGILDRLEREFGDARYRLAKEALRDSGARNSLASRLRGVFAAIAAWARRTAGPSTGSSSHAPMEADDTTGEASGPDPKTFCDDEDGYLDWVRRNSSGWVINAGRHFARSDRLVLHSATCGAITTIGNHTTQNYIKVCSTDRAALMAWARRVEWVRSDADISTGCPFCSP